MFLLYLREFFFRKTFLLHIKHKVLIECPVSTFGPYQTLKIRISETVAVNFSWNKKYLILYPEIGGKIFPRIFSFLENFCPCSTPLNTFLAGGFGWRHLCILVVFWLGSTPYNRNISRLNFKTPFILLLDLCKYNMFEGSHPWQKTRHRTPLWHFPPGTGAFSPQNSAGLAHRSTWAAVLASSWRLKILFYMIIISQH